MIARRVPSIGLGALFVAAAIAAALPTGWQVGYAAAVLGVLGLPHGAADLALVPAARRRSFLAAYLATGPAIVALWLASPALALAGFLLASFVHFAADGREGPVTVRDMAVAATLIGGPVACHHAAIVDLFAAIGAAGPSGAALAGTLRALGIAGAPVALGCTLASRERPGPRVVETIAIAAAVAAPPLIGFAVAFVVLHARDQTIARQRLLGLPGLAAYLRRVAPVLAGAVLALAALAMIVPPSPAGVRMLFVAISALAMPHMLVTPLWTRRRGARGAGRGPVAPSVAR